jgi:hypothetical protein
MTLETAIEDIFTALGKITWLDPYESDGETIDATSAGFLRLRRWINRGYKRILNWKFRSGKLIRFAASYGSTLFQVAAKSGTATAGSSTTITLASGTVDDEYNEWVVKITGGTGEGQVRVIVDFVGSTQVATVHKAWDTTPDATSEYELYHRKYEFLESSNARVGDHIALAPQDILSVMKITRIEDSQDLSRGSRTTFYAGGMDTVADRPRAYIDYDESVIFDVNPSESGWYRMEYQKVVEDLNAASDEFLLPEPWAEAVIMWVIWYGLKMTQEPDKAWAAKNDLRDFMESNKQPFEQRYERSETHVVVPEG